MHFYQSIWQRSPDDFCRAARPASGRAEKGNGFLCSKTSNTEQPLPSQLLHQHHQLTGVQTTTFSFGTRSGALEHSGPSLTAQEYSKFLCSLQKKKASFQICPADRGAIVDEKCCLVWFLNVSFPGRNWMDRVL